MDKTQEDKCLRVIDSSLTEEHPQRVHEIMVGGKLIEVVFSYGEDKILPFEQGIKFMKQGFIVEDVDGIELELPAVASDSVAQQLKAGECIARFNELTTPALKLRAAQRQGGEIYLEATDEDREGLVAFLSGKAPDDVSEVETIDGEENLLEEDEEEENQSPNPTPEEELEQFKQKYGGTFTEVMNGLLEKFGAEDYSSDPEGTLYKIGDVQGTLDDLIAMEGLPPKDKVTMTDADGNTDNGPSNDSEAQEVVENPETTEPEEVTTEENSDVQDEEKTPEESTESEGDPLPEEKKEETFTLDEIKHSTDQALELAVAHGISISEVKGTGANGNVLKPDVEAYIKEHNIQPLDVTK